MMDSIQLTLLISGLLLVAGVLIGFISARLMSNHESDTIDLPGSGLIISPPQKRLLFPSQWRADYLHGLSTELVGAALTTVLLGVFLVLVQRSENENARKAQLILQMGSPDRGFAVEAARQLYALGWLQDGSLKHANLRHTDLSGVSLRSSDLSDAVLWDANLSDVDLEFAILSNADLRRADLSDAVLDYAVLDNTVLSGAVLRGATLENANLFNADLESADLRGANLQNANLWRADLTGTNLQNANLWRANLSGAGLWGANLRSADLQYTSLRARDLSDVDLSGANLRHADLQDANISEAQFDESTTLPDNSKWTLETNMTRFTDPNHPDFWRSDDRTSPAYKDKD